MNTNKIQHDLRMILFVIADTDHSIKDLEKLNRFVSTNVGITVRKFIIDNYSSATPNGWSIILIELSSFILVLGKALAHTVWPFSWFKVATGLFKLIRTIRENLQNSPS